MDRSIIARASELVARGDKPVPASEALKQALDERCHGDYGLALELLVVEGRSRLKDARQRTYALPEQPTLFDLPSVIAITTPLGDLFIPSDMATAGQVEQWAREGQQHHGSQHKRFKAMAAQLKGLGFDESENYQEQVRSLKAPE
jgi:hypothetical protein